MEGIYVLSIIINLLLAVAKTFITVAVYTQHKCITCVEIGLIQLLVR